MQTLITCRCVIEEEIEELGEKLFRRPLSGNRFTRQLVGIHWLARAPTLTRLLKTVSCLALRIPQQAPCCICHHWLLPMLPSSTEILFYTIKGCGKCLGYQPLNVMEMER